MQWLSMAVAVEMAIEMAIIGFRSKLYHGVVPTGVSWAPAVQGNKQLGPQQLVSNSSNCQLVPTVNHNLRAVKIATVL